MTARKREPEVLKSLIEIFGRNWFPVYAFVRREWGKESQDAKDMTQNFFLELLNRDCFAGVAQEKSKFRIFLLACLGKFHHDNNLSAVGPDRGIGQPIVAFDMQDAERRFGPEPVDSQLFSAAEKFDRDWALNVLENAVSQLKNNCAAEGKEKLFALLCPYLTGNAETRDFAKVSAQLAMTEGAERVAVTGLRSSYQQVLREQVAETLENPTDLDDEIRYLCQLLGK